jgi:hypothetical protein
MRVKCHLTAANGLQIDAVSHFRAKGNTAKWVAIQRWRNISEIIPPM